MSLSPGTRLGPYEILSLLGAGGMGEVYRARDARLGRDVAIKALPATLAHDPERLARFEREARLLASLNHPNIAAIYGLEEVEGRRYLVLEFVEGETLAQRVERGALSLDETLTVCREVAAGVEAAHENGVVHRDLKPANVMMTAAGVVKVLDFGLAKGGTEGSEIDSNPSLSASPTMTYAATREGVILGTAAYMSPEQARGKRVDRRTDIWSFGCVLFECLSGKPAFEGETVSDLVARILEREPDWNALPTRTPARVRDLLKRCMIKDPKQRLRDIGDARVELDQLLALGTSGVMASTDASPAPPTRRGVPWWSAAALVVLAVVATVLTQSQLGRRAAIVSRHFEIAAPEPLELRAEPAECAISPDGRTLAMVLTDSAGAPSLWVRGMDSFRARMLPGTSRATQPFWSPDSRSLAFFSGGKLKKIAVASGDPEVLCDVRAARGGAWNRDGVILFAPTSNGPLFTIPAGGGEPKAVTQLDSTRHETAHRFPRFLPDGRHYLFSVLDGNADRISTFAGELGSVRRKLVLTAEGGIAFSPSGHLLFTRNGVLSAQRFDPGSLEVSGEPVSLGDTPPLPEATGSPMASIASDGTLAYVSAPLPVSRLAWFDLQAHELAQVPLAAGTYFGISLSPDGRSALITHAISNKDFELLAVDLERGTYTRIPAEQAVENFAWSPDGRRIAYAMSAGGSQTISVVSADGGSAEVVMSAGRDFRRIDGWTPDGKALIIERLDPQTQWDLWVLPVEGDRQPRPLLRGPANETRASVSPDGRWLSYSSDESGRGEGYVQAWPTLGRRYQVTTDGAGALQWILGGKRLALEPTPNRMLRSVEVLPGDEFRVGPTHIAGRIPDPIFGADVNREGTKLLAAVPAGKQPQPTIRIVLDWTAMLAAH